MSLDPDPCLDERRVNQLTAAVFGLVGVIVGGVLNGLVSAWQERRARDTAYQAGARLVRSELVFYLGVARRIGFIRPDDIPQLRNAKTELWQSNRKVLATTLHDRAWVLTARAYAYVDALLSLMAFERDGRLADWRVREATHLSKAMIEPLRTAIEVMAPARIAEAAPIDPFDADVDAFDITDGLDEDDDENELDHDQAYADEYGEGLDPKDWPQ